MPLTYDPKGEQPISHYSMSEILEYFNESDELTNGMEFITDEQVMREYNRWESEAQKRGLMG